MALDDALERSIEQLTERFPQLPAATIAETVYAAHAHLHEHSVITDHLVPLAHRRALDTLIALAADTTEAAGIVGAPAAGHPVLEHPGV